jgi:hypothetical protein
MLRKSAMLEKSAFAIGRALCVGALWAWGGWSLAAPVTVKSVPVDARVMKFPGISLDGITYEALSFEYGMRGHVEMRTINAALETLQCNGQTRQNHYLAVDYRGPEIIFRIKDERKNRVLLLQKLDTDGTYEYGQGVCDGNAGLKARFEQEQSTLLAALDKQVKNAALTQMETYIQNNTALDYEDLNFPLFYFSADGSRYESLNRAFDRARDAFALSTQFGITKEADDLLKLVAATWEKEANNIAAAKSPAPEDELVSLALHRNLAQVYFFLRKYDMARRHDAMAVSKGMPEEESRQALILEHERRTILSPQVAGNVVLTANLYRFGRNSIREARLVEVDNFADLEQALSQR